jgi:hypothetical protein
MKKTSSFSFGAVLAAAAITSVLATSAEGLTVTNGDFSDLTGLTAQPQIGWYQGVPAGWTSTAVDPTYAVLDGTIGNPPPVANLGQLAGLGQNVGTTVSASQVTLKFDLGTFSGVPNVTVRITDGDSVVYASAVFTTAANNQILTASVGEGMPVYIEFLRAGSSNPWLNNVSVSTTAYNPEVINGDFADLGGLTELGEGWYAGVPEGWTTTAPSENGYEYSLRQVAGTYYANLDVLGNVRGGFNPLRQSLGVVDPDSNITVSFKTASLDGNPYAVGSAIFDAFDDTPLAVFSTPAPVNGVTTVTYSAYDIPAGTEVYVAFWSTLPSYSPGITDVVVSLGTAETTVTLEPGAVLTLDAETPVTTPSNIVFQPGTTVSVSGAPADPEVALLSSLGSISGAPVLDPPVAGYSLANTGNLLWLRPADGSSLGVFNGNFNNLSGLTVAFEVPTGEIWYSGVPQGWLYTRSGASPIFTVYETIPGDAAANLSVLGNGYSGFSPLTQNVGTMERTGNITVTFDVLKLNGEDPVSVGAAIFNAVDNSILANVAVVGTSGPDTGTFSVTANDVAAGTPIKIAFWSGLNAPAYPFLDNVTIEVAANAYNSWAAGYSLDPATNGAPGADPDGDGFLNSSEFAFGTNPTTGNPALVRTSTVGGQVVMSWLQRIDSPSAYTVQETSDLALGPWTASPASVQPGSGPVPPVGYEWKQISVTPAGKKFYRVTASL